MKSKPQNLPVAVAQFNNFPGSALIDISAICLLTGQSRATINRHFASGRLTRIKIGTSTRARVGEVRLLIQAEPVSE